MNAKILILKFSDILSKCSDLVFRDQDKEAIWIIGDGRSGSTWLMEMINYENKYRCMFEPFHPTKVEKMKDIGFFKYIRPDYEDEFFYKLASEVFSGKFHHPRVTGGNSDFHQKLLIKDIFANLFVKWVSAHFPQIKEILLMRHPFAVALSKRNMIKWDWMTEPKQFLNQRELYEDFLQPYENLIRITEGFFAKQVLIWSIIHYVALKQLNNQDILLVFYEHLCSKPEKELKRIFSFLDESKKGQIEDPKLLEKIAKSSNTSHKNSAIVQGNNLYDVWRKNLSESTINNGIKILQTFGLVSIYNKSLMPKSTAAEVLLKG